MYAMAMSSAERYREICVVLAQKQIFLHLSTGQSPRTQKTAGFLSLHCGVNQSPHLAHYLMSSAQGYFLYRLAHLAVSYKGYFHNQ